jgi:hypothetical protein
MDSMDRVGIPVLALRRTSICYLARFAAVIGVILGAFLWAPTAAQAITVDEVATQLRAQNVYNDPAAQNALTSSQVGDLQAQISTIGLPIYIAVLPESLSAAAGGPDQLLRDVRDSVGRGGVYAIIAGNAFRAGGTDYSVSSIAESAFASQRSNGPFAVLEAFVAGVDAQYGAGAAGGGSNSAASGIAVLVFLLIVIAVIAVVVIFAVRRSRRQRALWAAQMRDVLDEDITELGERLGSFDLADPRLDQSGRDQLQTALDAYAHAGDRSATLTSEADVAATTKALDDGRYALACVEASMKGEAPPARRAPCFFDPRHGVSLEDVMWAPRLGQAHEVPACTVCSTTIAEGGTPQAREVEVAGVRQPYWDAGSAYAPYARGYFSGFGTTMAAAFAGTMIANSLFTPAVASASGFGADSFTSSGGGGGFGGGDFGGGGFGGGDFGGGGFGGGDF